jgi:hypothetical protein
MGTPSLVLYFNIGSTSISLQEILLTDFCDGRQSALLQLIKAKPDKGQ